MPDATRLFTRWMRPDSRSRRLVWAATVYVACVVVFMAVAGPERLVQHTM